MEKIIVIIPVYNEAEVIQKVVNDWYKILPNENSMLFVIDDGSTDNTKDILRNLKNNLINFDFITKKNGGHGDSIIFGYKYAINEGYDYIFQVDSDDQFSSEDFYKLWNLRNHDIELILGNRKRRKDAIIRVVLSKIFLRLFCLIIFQKLVLDLNIPFRLIQKNLLKNFINNVNLNMIAPNIFLSIYANKIINKDVEHFSRKTGEINWSIKRIFKFGFTLLIQLLIFRFTKNIYKKL